MDPCFLVVNQIGSEIIGVMTKFYWSDVEVFIGNDEILSVGNDKAFIRMMLKSMTKFLLECIGVMLKFLLVMMKFLLVGDDEVLMLLKFLLVMTQNFYWLVMTKF